MSVRLCPRCGQPYKSIRAEQRGGRIYYYAYHGRDGKKTVRCYLGPDTYEYATTTHGPEGLLLHGAVHDGRAISYLRAILDFFVRSRSRSLKEQAIRELEAYLDRLRAEVRQLEAQERMER